MCQALNNDSPSPLNVERAGVRGGNVAAHGAGSTGYQPVPSGHWPDGTAERPLWNWLRLKMRGALPIPRGRLPRGTGGSPVLPTAVSLAPGFSRVLVMHSMSQPFQRLPRADEKPLKRLNFPQAPITRLKPGANENWTRWWIFTLALFLITTSSHASDWPQFRGPTGLGYVTDKNLPLHWNAKSNVNIAWKAALPKSDNAYSSPVVSGDRVFVTSAVNNPVEHHVLCFARADGRLLWDTPVEPGPWILKDLRGGYGAPTPCTDGKNVFVVFGSAVIASLDFDGKVVWRKPLTQYNFDVALGSSPILHKNTVVLDCDQNNKTSSFIAFDKGTGDIQWEQKRPQAIYAHSTPVIVDVNGKAQMLVSANKAIESLNPDNGETLWWCAAPGDASSPAFARNLVFADSGRGGKAVCVEATGTGDVSKTHLKWTFPQIPEGLSSALIVGDFVFRTHNPETVKCLRLSTGELVFNERLPGVSTWASPFATTDGTIYFASAGKSYVTKIGGEGGTNLVVLATNDVGEENRATAAVADGKIFLRGNKNLYCIGAKP